MVFCETLIKSAQGQKKEEQKMKKATVIVLVVMMASFFSMVDTADAECNLLGQIIRVSTQPGTNESYIYFRTSSLANFYFFGVTTDSKLINAALSALNGHARVLIRGSAGACPSSGSVGRIFYIAESP